MRELSGRFCRRERLFHRRGLLRADDSGARDQLFAITTLKIFREGQLRTQLHRSII